MLVQHETVVARISSGIDPPAAAKLSKADQGDFSQKTNGNLRVSLVSCPKSQPCGANGPGPGPGPGPHHAYDPPWNFDEKGIKTKACHGVGFSNEANKVMLMSTRTSVYGLATDVSTEQAAQTHPSSTSSCNSKINSSFSFEEADHISSTHTWSAKGL